MWVHLWTFRAALVIVGFNYPLHNLLLFDAAMTSIQEALASLGQRIDGQQTQQAEVAPPPVTLPIPTLEDPHAQEGIARGLWPESFPIDFKVKNPSGEQRSRDVGAISSVGMRPSGRYQTVGQTS
ncbi:hypothetical protein CK203_043876 [Vitis vinifera]|uniref:Uncharacterized protein n=1 Tax=Vitis vinifera TaxID=29760 RepID=A0A438HVB0_VITVI|nr:hypothetical protein CK203_043876 [Vitis vinifera]